MTDFSLADFLAMGGYGAFVWPAYGVTLVVLAAIWLDGARRRRAVERALQALQRENGEAGK